ncbi:MAG: hypothetical protein IPL12_07560 [Bacteroidetes bacterium]|nr:hypothetical protein [Bacteroidota bacterium]
MDVDGNGADDFRIEAVYYDWTTFAGEFGYFSIEPLGENGVLFYTERLHNIVLEQELTL